jgi:hypothetical protein
LRPGEVEERCDGALAVLPEGAVLRRPAAQKEVLALQRHAVVWLQRWQRPKAAQRRQWGAAVARLLRLPRLVSARGWP